MFPGTRHEDWPVADPAGQDLDAVRGIRDELERRVRRLVDELDLTPTGGGVAAGVSAARAG